MFLLILAIRTTEDAPLMKFARCWTQALSSVLRTTQVNDFLRVFNTSYF